jgi:hypothetical protein
LSNVWADDRVCIVQAKLGLHIFTVRSDELQHPKLEAAKLDHVTLCEVVAAARSYYAPGLS